jgi:site-specific DNA recombinase
MRVIIYTRTRSGTGSDASRQLEQCRALATCRRWDVTEVFTDQDVSGRTLDRPGLTRAMQLVRNHGCDVLADAIHVLIRSASGFASITSNAGASGVAVVTADGAVDTSSAERRFAAWVVADFTRQEAGHDASAGR